MDQSLEGSSHTATERQRWVDNGRSVSKGIRKSPDKCVYCNGLIVNWVDWKKKFSQIKGYIAEKYGEETSNNWEKKVLEFISKLENNGELKFCPTCPSDISNLILRKITGKKDKELHEIFYKPFEDLF